MDVTPRFAEVFRSVLSGVGGSIGGWRCCWDAPSLPQLPPATPKNPPPYISLLFVCFCSDGINQHNMWAAGGKSIFIWEAGWEEPFGNKSTFGCFRTRSLPPLVLNMLPFLNRLFVQMKFLRLLQAVKELKCVQ